jgi:hypothetical protein
MKTKLRWLDDVVQDLKILKVKLGERRHKTEIVGSV